MNTAHLIARISGIFWLAAVCTIAPMISMAEPAPAKTRPQVSIQQPVPRQSLVPLPGPAPAILSLTPASATNVTIAWSPAAGAIRYFIKRDGAPDIPIDPNAGFFQNGQFAYGDVGRRPATIHTYSIAAEFPAPTLPSRSRPFKILMPTAYAPANFRAAVSGPSAVTLTWTGRPEATGYRVVRSSGNWPQMTFDVTGNSFIDQSAPAGAQYTYVICSLMKLASGEQYGGEFSAPVTLKKRSFNVLAVGDSVMWGQGLSTADKFSSKVAAWIGSQLGIAAVPSLKAHSGAVTYIDPGTPSFENRSYDGEVPSTFPTIAHQIDVASSSSASNPFPASDVDLVLVDGCANDIGLTTVLAPLPPSENDALRAATRAYCNGGMSNILAKTVQAFPNADIVVTGYFRFVTPNSDLAALVPVFALIGTVATSLVIPPDPVLTGLVLTQVFKDRAVDRSQIFFEESQSALQTAVNWANTTLTVPGRTRFNQVHFAPLSPAAENSYASPSTWQWLIPTPPFVQDEVYIPRTTACIQVSNATNGNTDLLPGIPQLCPVASMGHPNVAGAQAYTDAIKSVTSSLIPQWRADHQGPAATAPDSIVVSIQLGADDAAGAPIVVAAVDGISSAPLQGRVLFAGVDAGALGAPLHYAYSAANPVDIVATVQPQGRLPRYFSIPTRTFSVAVTVANNSSMVATATDAMTGQSLAGSLTIYPNTPKSFSAQTGQAISFGDCAAAMQIRPVFVPGQSPCSGIVHVPYYPDVRF